MHNTEQHWVCRLGDESEAPVLQFFSHVSSNGHGPLTAGVSTALGVTPVKSSPPTNQHTASYRPDALPVAEPTVSKH